MENLRWGNDNATRRGMRRGLRVWPARTSSSTGLPDGYDTHIEQGGTNVSGGQKQRLCIARALLKKPQDPDSGRLHLRRGHRDGRQDPPARLPRSIPGTTKLIIAQRISSVQDADRIIVLDNGRVKDVRHA